MLDLRVFNSKTNNSEQPMRQLIHATMFTLSKKASWYPSTEHNVAKLMAISKKGFILLVNKLAKLAGITSMLITMIAPTDSKLNTVLSEVSPRSK